MYDQNKTETRRKYTTVQRLIDLQKLKQQRIWIIFCKTCSFFVILFALGSGVYVDSNASIYVVFGAKLAGLWTNYWRRICPKTVNVIGGRLKRRSIRGSQTRFKALIRAFLTSPKSHETEENSWWYNIFYISTTGQIVYATVCEVLWISLRRKLDRIRINKAIKISLHRGQTVQYSWSYSYELP